MKPKTVSFAGDSSESEPITGKFDTPCLGSRNFGKILHKKGATPKHALL